MSGLEGSELALAVSLLAPLVAAVIVAATGRLPNLRDSATVVATLVTFLSVVRLLPATLQGETIELEVVEVLNGWVLAFSVEPLGMIFALVSSSLWIVTSIYAFGYMRGHHEKNQTRFFICFALSDLCRARHCLRAQRVYPVSVLRGAHVLDVSAGDTPRHRGSA